MTNTEGARSSRRRVWRAEMTSGGLSMAEGWNLQLQARVRDLEADLAEAEARLLALTDDMRSSVQWTLARGFLARMEDKRQRAALQAADIAALISEHGAAEDESGPPSNGGNPNPRFNP